LDISIAIGGATSTDFGQCIDHGSATYSLKNLRGAKLASLFFISIHYGSI
jgi:hypothetical protein